MLASGKVKFEAQKREREDENREFLMNCVVCENDYIKHLSQKVWHDRISSSMEERAAPEET